MKSWTKITGSILAVAAIIGMLYTVTNVNKIDIYHLFNNLKNDPIKITMEPRYITEAAYPYPEFIPITFTISSLKNNNITYLELAKTDLSIDRLNKTDQIKYSNYINWDNSYNNNYIILYNKISGDFSSDIDNLTLSGKLYNCPNCFMGKDYPYVFTFIFKYKQNDGILTPFTYNITVPIK